SVRFRAGSGLRRVTDRAGNVGRRPRNRLPAKRWLWLRRGAVRRCEIGRARRRITPGRAFPGLLVGARTIGLYRRAVCVAINGGRTVRATGLFSGLRADVERR